MPVQKIDIEFRKRQLVVQSQTRLQRFFGKKLARNITKCFGKEIEIFLAHCQPGCHLMSAVFVEAVSATIQRFDQIKSFDASSASLAHSVLVETNHNRRAMIFSNK